MAHAKFRKSLNFKSDYGHGHHSIKTEFKFHDSQFVQNFMGIQTHSRYHRQPTALITQPNMLRVVSIQQ